MACLRGLLFPWRDETPRSRFPIVTLAILLANVAVYLYGLTLDPAGQRLLVLQGGAVPLEITTLRDIYPLDLVPPPFSIFTSMFLHGGLLHLLGNMWFLWIFGDNVEDVLGPVRYGLFYLFVGVVGALAQVFTGPDSTLPMIGASGAIAGILGAYLMLFPHARIVSILWLVLWAPRLVLPAWLFLGLWFVMQFFTGSGSGVAWVAHVGGFLAGLGAVRLLAPPRRPTPVMVEYTPPPPRRPW